MTRSTMVKLLVAGALAIGAAQSALAQSGICPLTNNPPVPATAPCNLREPILPAIGVPDTKTINPDTWAYGPNTDLTERKRLVLTGIRSRRGSKPGCRSRAEG